MVARELGGPALFLIDHGGRRARDEAAVRELRFGLRDLALQAPDFLVEPVELAATSTSTCSATRSVPTFETAAFAVACANAAS